MMKGSRDLCGIWVKYCSIAFILFFPIGEAQSSKPWLRGRKRQKMEQSEIVLAEPATV